jgi:MFS family permease
MRRIFDFLRTDDLPPMTRPNYAAEVRHIGLWALFANLVDGSFSSIVVAKTFHVPLLIPIVWATPMLANLVTFLWGVVIRDRPKVRTFVALAIGAVLSASTIALTPSDWEPWGGWLFAAQVACARIFLSGLIAVRSSLWKSNYPQSHRARIAGRIQTLSALLMLAIGAVVSLLFDRHAEYYRIVYPLIAVVGVLSLIPLRRIRVRGERAELRRLERQLAAGQRNGTWGRFRHGLTEASSILKRDRGFARYCTAQYLLGSANLMVDPVLTIFLTQSLSWGYFGSYLLMEQIPTVLALVTISRWAPLFDRVGVLRFRVVNTAIWLTSFLLVTVALFVRSTPTGIATAGLTLLVGSRIVNGIARGGGSIAWNIGHLHFAGEHDADLYMGIHVALTGLRGLLMSFVGTLAYKFCGAWALLLGVALAWAALVAFRRLAADAGPTPDQSTRSTGAARPATEVL